MVLSRPMCLSRCYGWIPNDSTIGAQSPIAKSLVGFPFLVIVKREIKIKSEIKIKNGKVVSAMILQFPRVTFAGGLRLGGESVGEAVGRSGKLFNKTFRTRTVQTCARNLHAFVVRKVLLNNYGRLDQNA